MSKSTIGRRTKYFLIVGSIFALFVNASYSTQIISSGGWHSNNYGTDCMNQNNHCVNNGYNPTPNNASANDPVDLRGRSLTFGFRYRNPARSITGSVWGSTTTWNLVGDITNSAGSQGTSQVIAVGKGSPIAYNSIIIDSIQYINEAEFIDLYLNSTPAGGRSLNSVIDNPVTVSLIGASKLNTVYIGKGGSGNHMGSLISDENIESKIVFTGDGAMSLRAGFTLTGGITAQTNNEGIVDLWDNTVITEQVGASNKHIGFITAQTSASSQFLKPIFVNILMFHTGTMKAFDDVVLGSYAQIATGTLDFDGNVTGNIIFVAEDGTVDLAQSKTIVGNTTASGDGVGTISLHSDSNITGSVGETGKSIKLLTSDSTTSNLITGTVFAKTITNSGTGAMTFSSDVVTSTNTININNTGIMNFNGNVTGNVEFSGDGTVNLAANKTIFGTIDNVTSIDSQGTLNLHNNSHVTDPGTIGATKKLSLIQLNDTTYIRTWNNNWNTDKLSVNSGTLIMDSHPTFSVLTNNATIVLNSGSEITTDSLVGNGIYQFPLVEDLTMPVVTITNANHANLSGHRIVITTNLDSSSSLQAGVRTLFDSSHPTSNAQLPTTIDELPSFILYDLSLITHDGDANGASQEDIVLYVALSGNDLENYAYPYNKPFLNYIDDYGDNLGDILNDLYNYLNNTEDTEELNDRINRNHNALTKTSAILESKRINAMAGQFFINRGLVSSGKSAYGQTPNTEEKTPKGDNLWGLIFGQFSDQETIDNFHGYDASTFGIAIGKDKQLTTDLLLGVAFSYANIAVNVANNYGKTDIENFQFSLYGVYDFTENLYVAAQTSYTLGYNKSYRYNAGIPPPQTTAKGDYFSNQFLIQTRVGYILDLSNNMTLTPLFINDFAYYQDNSYTESGLNPNLQINSFQISSYNIGAGFNYEWDIPVSEKGRVNPFLFVGYTYDLLNKAIITQGKFKGGPNNNWSVTSPYTPGPHSFLLSTGLASTIIENLDINLNYNLVAQNQYFSQGGNLTISYSF